MNSRASFTSRVAALSTTRTPADCRTRPRPLASSARASSPPSIPVSRRWIADLHASPTCWQLASLSWLRGAGEAHGVPRACARESANEKNKRKTTMASCVAESLTIGCITPLARARARARPERYESNLLRIRFVVEHVRGFGPGACARRGTSAAAATRTRTSAQTGGPASAWSRRLPLACDGRNTTSKQSADSTTACAAWTHIGTSGMAHWIRRAVHGVRRERTGPCHAPHPFSAPLLSHAATALQPLHAAHCWHTRAHCHPLLRFAGAHIHAAVRCFGRRSLQSSVRLVQG